MAKPPVNWLLWAKTFVAGVIICVGGPALTKYVMPTDEELFKRYNPELQKKSLEGREKRQQEFDEFVTKLKEQSRSNKPIWTVQKEDEDRQKQARLQEAQRKAEAAKAMRQEIRKQAGLPSD